MKEVKTMYGFILGYYRFSVWTLRLAYVNFCWILFTLLGLVLFGFMPATAAMFSIVRKWIGQRRHSSFYNISKTFQEKLYRNEWIGARHFPDWIPIIDRVSDSEDTR